jgi:prevent-host-death family protein
MRGYTVPGPILYNNNMTTITLDDMQRDVTSYVKRAEAGETIRVTDGGRPVAEIKPVVKSSSLQRPFGLFAGQFTVPDDFDEPLPHLIADLDGYARPLNATYCLNR